MRCLTLADALNAADWTCAFACSAGTTATIPALLDGRHKIIPLEADSGDEAAALLHRWPNGCDLLIVDHYERDAEFEIACRPWARRIMIIDDLADRRHVCDLLLDQTSGRQDSDYLPLVSTGCELLLGSRFALLRPQFSAARVHALKRRRECSKIRRILVSFGASDPRNITRIALEGIALSDIDADVDVVLGATSLHDEDLRNLADTMAQVVEFHTQVTDMASLMTHADLAIGAAGTSSWERCCLGLPSLVVVMADNQRMVAAELENAGAAIVLGWHEIVNAANIADRIAELMPNPERLLAMSVNTAAICDGHGAARIVAQLDPPRARDGEPVSLRPMNAADGDLLLGWQSHPMTRRYFNNPCIPTPLEHRRWLAHRLRSETCLLNLIMHGNRPAGMVRLDRKPGESTHEIFEVSILIDPGAHGQGLGSAALELIRLLIPDAVFEARVNPENTASIALFLSAGYVQQGDLFICEPRFA